MSLDYPLLYSEVTSCNLLVSGVPPLDNQRYSGTFSVKIDDASRMISLLTRMDKLRLSSARQRLKLLAAATFNCRLG